MNACVTVLELIAWPLDHYPHRPAELTRTAAPAPVQIHQDPLPCLDAWDHHLKPLYCRPDLQAEFIGLTWRLDIIDLRRLIAFQRRLILDPTQACLVPQPEDRAALTALAFGPPRPTTHQRADAHTILSTNPDLVLRPTTNGFALHGGSPFLEVAACRGRMLLRDGYHRAYHLLKAGIPCVPAVVIDAQTFTDTGADAPWFFPEHVLFSARPPLLTDFLDPALTVTYPRSRLLKTLRIHIEETFTST